MGDWEAEDNLELRKAGAQRFDDVVDDDVDDDWDAEEEDEQPKPQLPKHIPEVKVKSADELAAEIQRKKEIERQKNESAEERKARIKNELDRSAMKDVEDLFGDADDIPKKSNGGASLDESKELVAGGKGLSQYPLERVEQFTDLADDVCIRVLSQKGSAQIIRTGRLAFFNTLIDRFCAEFTGDELKDLASKLKSLQLARTKEEKEKAAAYSAKKKGGKKAAPKKSVKVERDDFVRDDDVFYDEDDY